MKRAAFAALMLFTCTVAYGAAAEPGPAREGEADGLNHGMQVSVPVPVTVLPAPSGVPPPWNAEAEVGIIMTGGNTETESTNVKFKVENERLRWRHRLDAEFLKISDAQAVTAEQYAATAKSDLKVDERDYFYLTGRYVDDVFAGYRYQASEAAGYGRRLLVMPQVILELEAGLGGRQTKYVDDTRDDDTILRAALKYVWKLGTQGELSEEAFTEIGGDNTHTESVTAVKNRLNGMLAVKLSFTLKHDSRVKPGTRKTDRTFAATLVFDLI